MRAGGRVKLQRKFRGIAERRQRDSRVAAVGVGDEDERSRWERVKAQIKSPAWLTRPCRGWAGGVKGRQ